MNEPTADAPPPGPAATESCAQCGRTITAIDRVAAGDRVFCRSCYASLRAELEQVARAMSSDIHYGNAAAGALLGGAAGVLLWWGFTVLTQISFGLVALAIGFLVGYGTVRFAGGKRSAELQALSVSVSLVSFFCASYLVNMTFINRALARQGDHFRIVFPPDSVEAAYRVLAVNFGLMDVVFLAIVLYQAWKIPRPIALPSSAG
jgi:hypothetical protein